MLLIGSNITNWGSNGIIDPSRYLVFDINGQTGPRLGCVGMVEWPGSFNGSPVPVRPSKTQQRASWPTAWIQLIFLVVWRSQGLTGTRNWCVCVCVCVCVLVFDCVGLCQWVCVYVCLSVHVWVFVSFSMAVSSIWPSEVPSYKPLLTENDRWWFLAIDAKRLE